MYAYISYMYEYTGIPGTCIYIIHARIYRYSYACMHIYHTCTIYRYSRRYRKQYRPRTTQDQTSSPLDAPSLPAHIHASAPFRSDLC